MAVLVVSVLVFTVFCIVSFMYIYSYLFYLYWCKDYCHRVTSQLQLVVVVVVVVVVIIIIIIIIIILPFATTDTTDTTDTPFLQINQPAIPCQ